MKKRNLFTELSEGFEALASERAGKRTLRTHEVSIQAPAVILAGELLALRSDCICRARYLRATCGQTPVPLKTGSRDARGLTHKQPC